MFSANRNNSGYQNVASLMRHSAEYETTDVVDMVGARLAAQRLSSAHRRSQGMQWVHLHRPGR